MLFGILYFMADRGYIQSIGIRDILESAQYNDDQQVAFFADLPTVHINNWDDIKAVDKTSIHTIMLANQYSIDPNVS